MNAYHSNTARMCLVVVFFHFFVIVMLVFFSLLYLDIACFGVVCKILLAIHTRSCEICALHDTANGTLKCKVGSRRPDQNANFIYRPKCPSRSSVFSVHLSIWFISIYLHCVFCKSIYRGFLNWFVICGRYFVAQNKAHREKPENTALPNAQTVGEWKRKQSGRARTKSAKKQNRWQQQQEKNIDKTKRMRKKHG